MKKLTIKRILSAILTLCLLVCSQPAVLGAEPEKVLQKPAVQLMTEAKFAVGINSFNGDYVKFTDYNTNTAGICDYLGNVKMSGKNLDLYPLKNGMAGEFGGKSGWAILSPTGKRLTPYQFGEFVSGRDLYTNEQYNWVAGYGPDEKVVYVDANGKDPFGGKYQVVGDIYNGVFSYQQNGKWGIDTLDGRHILACKYEELKLVNKSVCTFRQNGKYGLMTLDGKVVLSAQDDAIRYEARADSYLVTKGMKIGLLNASFESVLPCEYDEISWITEDLFLASAEKNKVLVHSNGSVVRSFTNGYVQTICDEPSKCMFAHLGDIVGGERKITVFDETGKTVLEETGESASATRYLIILIKKTSVEIYDRSGALLNQLEGRANCYFKNFPIVDRYDMVNGAATNVQFVFIGKDGKPVEGLVFDEAYLLYSKGICSVRKGEKWNLISAEGTYLLDFWLDAEPSYSDSSEFAGYKVNGYYGIMRYVSADDCWFADIQKDAWYRTAADYCYENSLMSGTATAKFSPNVTTTRAMLVTILYSLSGAEKPSGSSPFADVPNGQWYTNAVIWAQQNGLVSGYANGNFGPNDAVTREQLALILQGYAKKFGIRTAQGTALDAFPDAAKVSPWAEDAVQWAVANGLISGSVVNGKTCIDPQGKATRAMVACIMMRFVELAKAAPLPIPA